MKIRLKPELEKLIDEGIAAIIEAGYAAAQRGELLDSDSLRQFMDERKTAWLGDRRNACGTINSRLPSRV